MKPDASAVLAWAMVNILEDKVQPVVLDTRPYIGKALIILREELATFIARRTEFANTPISGNTRKDVLRVLRWLLEDAHSASHKTLGNKGCALLKKAKYVRNRWAHQQDFSLEEAIRSIKEIRELLTIMDSQRKGDLARLEVDLREENDRILAFEKVNREWWQRRNQAGTSGFRFTEPPPMAYVPLPVPTNKRCCLCSAQVNKIPKSANPWTEKFVDTGLPDICSVCKMAQTEGLEQELANPPETWDLIIIMVISGASGGPLPISDLTEFLEEKGVKNPSEVLKSWQNSLQDFADRVGASEAQLSIRNETSFSGQLNSAIRYLSRFIHDD